jgi:hypothetical protein
MTRSFRLGFESLEAMNENGPLFDAETKATIERGDIHLVRAQWAATKPVAKCAEFLQLMSVIYGQTIARGQGIVDNAKHMGLKFTAYAHPDPTEDRLTGIMFEKLHGKKRLFSVALYDKFARLQQVHQEGALSVVEAETVNQSVREDITAHSEGILIIVEAAQRKLENMHELERKFFDFISPDEFLKGEPEPTVCWLQRAIYLLSHYRRQRQSRFSPKRWARGSFATWLVPYIERRVLQFDLIARITTEGYHALLALDDKVAAAWRSDKTPCAGNWAGRFAKVAGCAPRLSTTAVTSG